LPSHSKTISLILRAAAAVAMVSPVSDRARESDAEFQTSGR
jgi:hypothetical protein